MKLLILANDDAGLYRFRKELIHSLLAEGHEVSISLPYGRCVEKLVKAGCKYIETDVDRRGLNPVTDLKLFLAYRRIIRSVQPDWVITYTIKPNIYGGLAARLTGCSYAVNITGLGTAFQKKGILRKLVTVMYQVALKKTKVVFFENTDNQALFIRERIVREEKTCVLNGAGVNLGDFPYQPYPEQAQPFRFLFVGRVMQEKGVDELFAAMKALRQDGIDCTLEILGGYEEDYSETVRAYEDEGWLKYHGFQPDVVPFAAASHCFVLPSWHEGMANVNLENAAMGRPVITSNIPGCKEAVIENETGLLCEPKNAESLYQVMKKMAQMRNAERKAMGLAGRKHMEDVFDKKKVVEKTLTGLGISLTRGMK